LSHDCSTTRRWIDAVAPRCSGGSLFPWAEVRGVQVLLRWQAVAG
jgi:hypothetical protein